MGIFVLLLVLEEMLCIIFLLSMIFNEDLCIFFFQLKCVSNIHGFSRTFIMKECWILFQSPFIVSNQIVASVSDQQKRATTQRSSQSSLFRNLSTCKQESLLAPNRNPLYNPSTTPHQPSPRNSSPLARIITRHMVRSCIMVHLRSSPSGRGLFSGV